MRFIFLLIAAFALFLFVSSAKARQVSAGCDQTVSTLEQVPGEEIMVPAGDPT